MTDEHSAVGAARTFAPERWGAQPSDWAHFDLVLGLGADLLPVVSNPNATIDPRSGLKALGKTPSRYGKDRTVFGISEWTQHVASDNDIARWAKERDYGICVQTRTVRAIDIDVSDTAEADEIEHFLANSLGLAELPCRVRGSSPRRLVVLHVNGDRAKSAFKTTGGLVELLADGQQFVAIGAHPSGDRYAWRNGLPDSIPVVPLEQMDAAWDRLVERFAVEVPRAARVGGAGAGGVDAGIEDDDIAQWLETNWQTFGVKDRKLFVECPWKSGHSGDSGPTEASWMLAGTGGYAQGHFNCLHASCQGRKDDEFLDAVGYRESMFETDDAFAPPMQLNGFDHGPEGVNGGVSGLGGGGARSGAGLTDGYNWPSLRDLLAEGNPALGRDKKGILATQNNHNRALNAPAWFGWFIGKDTFLDEIMVCPLEKFGLWERLSDNHYTIFRARLEQLGFASSPKEMVRDGVRWVSEQHPFDSAQRWLESLTWDGVPRVRGFCTNAFGVREGPYADAVSRYIWTALAGRVMDPGCQADMAPIFTGLQGARKSSALMAMSPSPEHFVNLSFSKIDDKDTQILIRGKLIGEFGELKGMSGKAREEVKEYVTKRVEEWVPKFMSCTVRYRRRLLFFGTTNEVEFLEDPTGERRWLPAEATHCDVAWIAKWRDQLWAEGLAMWMAEGVAWQDAERLAREVHSRFKTVDVWEDMIRRWLDREELDGTRPADWPEVATLDVLESALGGEARSFRKSDYRRLADAMVSIGYAKRGSVWKRSGTEA